MNSSRNTRRVSFLPSVALLPSGTGISRGNRSVGTLIRAKFSFPEEGCFRITARLSERFDMKGNGCEGLNARGVRTGYTSAIEVIAEICLIF